MRRRDPALSTRARARDQARRQGEGQPAVGKGDRIEPVAERGGLWRGGRGDLLEHLEGMMGGTGLALGGVEVGLESPAIAALGVAIAVEGRQRGCRIA